MRDKIVLIIVKGPRVRRRWSLLKFHGLIGRGALLKFHGLVGRWSLLKFHGLVGRGALSKIHGLEGRWALLKFHGFVGKAKDVGNGFEGDLALYDIQALVECGVILAGLAPAFVGKCEGIAQRGIGQGCR